MVSVTIPVYSSTENCICRVSETDARAMLAAGTHDLVRDRAGNTRRLYERQDQGVAVAIKEAHFRWRGKMSGGAIVMQAQRFGFS
jgi:hypothetical protein